MKTMDFIKKHPRCGFCGGGTPLQTIDHQPAKNIFFERARPKGLEFPACSTVERIVLQMAGVFHEFVALIGQIQEDGDATDWEALFFT